MSVLNRPYAGTWQPNRRVCVQWTPDFLVYLNGDTSLPGCQTCHHNINIQEFVNSISVDFGVEPGASNCTIAMAIPRHYGDSVFRDGNTLMRPGLEVHVYFRGYFPLKGMTTPNAQPVAGINLSDIPQHPYYPVFHGVVVTATHNYSGGFYTANLTCNGMLHFWEHMKLSGAQGGSFFGARPVNSGIQTTLTGHPMTGKSPYAIIYSLYRDTAGAADGVGFALSSRTNYGAVNTVTRDPLYALTLRYWENRFRGKIYGLRMHGASGQLFTSSQQAYLSMYGVSPITGSARTGNVSGSAEIPTDNPLSQDPALTIGLNARGEDGRVLRQADTRLSVSNNGANSFGLDVRNLQAFPHDLGTVGQVNLWESTYESKMDIAGAVVNVSGYEFYQDADGDLVFKPPLYNLDTSSSRVYRIEPEDIVSIDFTEGEPAATYIVVKGGALQNQRGVVDEAEWGCRSTYVDYKLVAQFGWIETSIESTYYTNAKSAFFFAINHLDRINSGTNGANVTIPLRPEIRPGYPVYIPHIDCFYYVMSVSHAMNIGSECTTTLTLSARRRKFLAPGSSDLAASTAASTGQLSQIDLRSTSNNVFPLQELDTNRVPRLVGFPNVVMAIDPTGINPLFQTLGIQAIERELTAGTRTGVEATARTNRRETFVWQFIQSLLHRSRPTLTPVGAPLGDGTTTSVDYLARNTNQRYTVAGVHGGTTSTLEVSFADISHSLDSYIANRNSLRDARTSLTRQLIEQQVKLTRAQASTPPQEPAQTNALAELEAINQRIATFQANFDAAPRSTPPTEDPLQQYVERYDNLASITGHVTPNANQTRTPTRALNLGAHSATANADKVILMSYLIGQFRLPADGDTARDASGTINESANLLQMMSDRKASLNLNVPGYYRYYSSSHPDPDQQGYRLISREVTESTEGETVTVERQSNREISRAGGFISGEGTNFHRNEVITSMSLREASGYLIDAWRRVVQNPPPSRAIIEILLAQWSYETGGGRAMKNFNFGGLKYGGGGYYTNYNTHERTAQNVSVALNNAAFQAYLTPQSGAAHFVQFVTDHNHVSAIQQYMANPGNASVYAEAMFRVGYFTGPTSVAYGRDLQRRLTDIRNSGIITDLLPESSAGVSPEVADRAQNPTPAPVAHLIPDSDINCAVLRSATNIQGVPEEDMSHYVERAEHTPTKGLYVRVIESPTPRVIPTNQIYLMTFEARGQQVVTRSPVVRFNPAQPRQLSDFVTACKNSGGTRQLINALTASFVGRVGSNQLGIARVDNTNLGELITLAVSGITGLSTATGPIAASTLILNIAGGVPNNYNPATSVALSRFRTGARAAATAILNEKAVALIKEVTLANLPALEQAQTALAALPHGYTDIPQAIHTAIAPWQDCLRKLFRSDTVPQYGPFRPVSEIQLTESSLEQFSPVFPVSDAQGYEHYGSYQYGRGLSIEPGGNYDRMMSSDPFQYFTDEQRERYLRALHSPAGARNAAVSRVLREVANNENFSNSDGARLAIEYARNHGDASNDRAALIRNGLRNYLMSNMDTVTKLPVNNVAYQLSELSPMGQDDSCSCRGAESDLLLAAYMAGANNFPAIVQTESEANTWVASQMEQAAVSWSDAQSRLRGMGMEQGRRSLLDSVEGWKTTINNVRRTTDTTVAAAPIQVPSDRLGERTRNLFVGGDAQRAVPPRNQ